MLNNPLAINTMLPTGGFMFTFPDCLDSEVIKECTCCFNIPEICKNSCDWLKQSRDACCSYCNTFCDWLVDLEMQTDSSNNIIVSSNDLTYVDPVIIISGTYGMVGGVIVSTENQRGASSRGRANNSRVEAQMRSVDSAREEYSGSLPQRFGYIPPPSYDDIIQRQPVGLGTASDVINQSLPPHYDDVMNDFITGSVSVESRHTRNTDIADISEHRTDVERNVNKPFVGNNSKQNNSSEMSLLDVRELKVHVSQTQGFS